MPFVPEHINVSSNRLLGACMSCVHIYNQLGSLTVQLCLKQKVEDVFYRDSLVKSLLMDNYTWLNSIDSTIKKKHVLAFAFAFQVLQNKSGDIPPFVNSQQIPWQDQTQQWADPSHKLISYTSYFCAMDLHCCQKTITVKTHHWATMLLGHWIPSLPWTYPLYFILSQQNQNIGGFGSFMGIVRNIKNIDCCQSDPLNINAHSYNHHITSVHLTCFTVYVMDFYLHSE